MKKFISAVMAGAIAFSAMSAVSASAVNYGDGQKIVVFGDSIAAGYGLAKNEFNYGEIIADYVGGSVENYAVTGATTSDMLKGMSAPTAEQLAAVKEADTIIISIGGNDIIRYAVSDLLQFAAAIGCIADGVDITNIPPDTSITDIMKIVDKAKLKEYAKSDMNKYNLNKRLLELDKKISMTDALDTRGQYADSMLIQNQIVPNIQKAVQGIKLVNPKAQIIIQSIYNPLELEKTYIASNFDETYQTVITSLLPIFDDILTSYKTQLAAAFSADDSVKIADVMKNFNASDSIDTGNSWYFTGMQREGGERDIHPNQLGHLEIAATILDTMGVEASEEGGVFRTIYMGNKDIANYPAAAKTGAETYIGSYILGDIDGNNSVDSTDASAILKEYAAISTTGGKLTGTAKSASDVDGNGSITSIDASSVLKYYASISTGGKTSFHAFRESAKDVASAED